MDFSKTFKAIWWGILILSLGYYLGLRFENIQAGKPTWFDSIVFIVWIAIALGPFFKEMEFLGFKFKQEVSKLKEHVSSEMASLRAAIQISSDQRQSMASTLNIGYPAPLDSQLTQIQDQIKQAIREAMGTPARPMQMAPTERIQVPPDDTQMLFAARLALESELRKIYRPTAPDISSNRRYLPIHKIIEFLVYSGTITAEIGSAIREVYAVCSLAVHGEELSPAKVDFVRNIAPDLVSALRLISSRYA